MRKSRASSLQAHAARDQARDVLSSCQRRNTQDTAAVVSSTNVAARLASVSAYKGCMHCRGKKLVFPGRASAPVTPASLLLNSASSTWNKGRNTRGKYHHHRPASATARNGAQGDNDARKALHQHVVVKARGPASHARPHSPTARHGRRTKGRRPQPRSAAPRERPAQRNMRPKLTVKAAIVNQARYARIHRLLPRRLVGRQRRRRIDGRSGSGGRHVAPCPLGAVSVGPGLGVCTRSTRVAREKKWRQQYRCSWLPQL